MFWFKKKKIVLDCFTTDPFAHEFTPIQPSVKYYPEWWTNLPPTIETKTSNDWGLNKQGTMKACRGFTELYKNSFVIPFWGNLEIDVKSKIEKQYFWRDNFSGSENTSLPHKTISQHPTVMFEGFLNNNYLHAKLNSPWFFKTNRYVQFAFVDPVWDKRELSDHTVLPGVLDFKYQHATNINLMIECRSEERTFLLEPGTPIAYIIPLSEEEIELRNHLISNDELIKLLPQQRIFFPGLINAKKYSRSKKFIDKHDERNKPKCPFGFK